MQLEHMAELKVGVGVLGEHFDGTAVSCLRTCQLALFLERVAILDPDWLVVRRHDKVSAVGRLRRCPLRAVASVVACLAVTRTVRCGLALLDKIPKIDLQLQAPKIKRRHRAAAQASPAQRPGYTVMQNLVQPTDAQTAMLESRTCDVWGFGLALGCIDAAEARCPAACPAGWPGLHKHSPSCRRDPRAMSLTWHNEQEFCQYGVRSWHASPLRCDRRTVLDARR